MTALTKCIETAKKAGCPRDQVETLINSAYIPLPWQWAFHAAAREADKPNGPVDIGAGGARGPGKSHVVLSQTALDDCQRVAGLKCLFLRQTGVAAKESFDDLVAKVISGHVEYRKTATSLKFPNGSRIILGGFKDDRDIDKYIGIEYDIIIVEELNQLSQERYEKLRGSLRTSKPNWRPRMYTSFNPGGKGHSFVKDRYVIPYRENTQTDTRFIPSTYLDNIHLNSEYIGYLEGLQGDIGKAWREGEWDLFSGQYFSEWRYEKHVVEPFAIPDTWPKFRSIDPSGRDGITSCHWYALDSDGRVWCYREYYWNPKRDGVEGRDYDEHAQAIAKLSRDKNDIEEAYKYSIIDTAAFAKAGFSETAVEIFNRNGVTGILPAAKERVIGWNAVHSYLRWKEKDFEDEDDSGKIMSARSYQQPKIKFFKTCVNIIRTIPLLQHDEKNPEDLDSDGEDHAADELRYFLRTLRDGKAPKALNLIERRLEAIRKQEASFDYQYKR